MMPQLDITADPQNERYRAVICDLPATVEVDYFPREISHAIKMLSQDPGVREAISRFSEFQLSDSAEYFFDSIERLVAENYIPTTEDILHLRVKTTGVYRTEVEFDGQTLMICDTSGERCERKKWVHCFPGTTVVFFLVALNDYQKVLEEDESIVSFQAFMLSSSNANSVLQEPNGRQLRIVAHRNKRKAAQKC
jgi:guanine nucleotide-binding protein subunit alpha